jgi:hypothetical protein
MRCHRMQDKGRGGREGKEGIAHTALIRRDLASVCGNFRFLGWCRRALSFGYSLAFGHG